MTAAEPSLALGQSPSTRNKLVRTGRLLAWFTIGWNTIEGVVAVLSRIVYVAAPEAREHRNAERLGEGWP